MSYAGLPFTLWQSVPFADRDARDDWNFHHWLHHVALAKKTNTFIVLLDDLFRGQPGPHARMHQAVALSLKIAAPLTLEDYDFSTRAQFEDFMASHAQIHSIANAAAAL